VTAGKEGEKSAGRPQTNVCGTRSRDAETHLKSFLRTKKGAKQNLVKKGKGVFDAATWGRGVQGGGGGLTAKTAGLLTNRTGGEGALFSLEGRSSFLTEPFSAKGVEVESAAHCIIKKKGGALKNSPPRESSIGKVLTRVLKASYPQNRTKTEPGGIVSKS